MTEKKERNYWPHTIIAMILAVVVAGAYSVNIAVNNPVQESTYFMKKYQVVENNGYELDKSKRDFDKNFTLTYSSKKFSQGINTISINIKDKKSAKNIDDAKITMLVTRPETNKYNQKLNPTSVKNGNYTFKNIKINKLGRWKILTTTKIGKYSGYNSYEVYAAK
jgi:nitrogen fixation protein FixH